MMELQSRITGNPFAPFTSGQINHKTLASPHMDSNDLAGTVNVLITIGNYTGELLFPEIGISIPIKPGDIVLYEGSRLLHAVTPIGEKEVRTSINLYVSSNAFI